MTSAKHQHQQLRYVTMYLIACGISLCLLFTGHASAADVQGCSFPLAFLNITPDRDEVGFVQIFAVSTNVSSISVQTQSELSEEATLDGPGGTIYNKTRNYNELTLIHATSPGGKYEERLAIMVSASSSDTQVYGVKADKGTTDGFLALPLTEESTEFFIAAWNCSHPQFFAALQIVAPLEDTCIEIYSVNGDSYVKEHGVYLETTYDTYTYTSNAPPYSPTDITGYFVNSSKPIALFAGHACAFVPETVFFCDHIVEQIPPVNELGHLHFVPPIIGRDPNAGTIIRAVSADPDYTSSKISWVSADGTTAGSVVVARGQYHQITNPLASQAMKVECEHRCLVMAYITGRNAVPGRSDAVPTDPSMMGIPSVTNFVGASGFVTASFCEIQSNVQLRQEFNNQVAIVAKTSGIGDIMLDGRAVSAQTQWSTLSNWGYSAAAVAVSHGYHLITVSPGSSATFGAFAYGHSLIDTSSSSYAYAASFKMTGTIYTGWRQRTQEQMQQQAGSALSTDCNQERILSGSAVAQHPSAASPDIMRSPIALSRSVNSDPMTDSCRDRYRQALIADLQDLSRTINYLICNRSMCPYLSGAPGTGVPVNLAAAVSYHNLFAAIDTASLSDSVSFTVQSTGSIQTAYVTVPFVGIMDTTAKTFTECRVEVRRFVRQFANWPKSTALLLAESGCPAITFTAPYEFARHPTVCAL